MKTMTCSQLGGACEKSFSSASFEEIAELSKAHGMEMFKNGDTAHMIAMNKMGEMMNDPEAMGRWFMSRKNEFESLPEDK